jgi:hypothetical protein
MFKKENRAVKGIKFQIGGSARGIDLELYQIICKFFFSFRLFLSPWLSWNEYYIVWWIIEFSSQVRLSFARTN